MNLFKNLMFLQGYLIDPRFADASEEYGETYGNRVASARFFGEQDRRSPAAAANTPATERAPTLAVGGCG